MDQYNRPDDSYVNIQVQGPAIQVERFLVLCKTIEKLCRQGASRTISFDVDGDGPGRLRFALSSEFSHCIGVDIDRNPVRVPGINDY